MFSSGTWWKNPLVMAKAIMSFITLLQPILVSFGVTLPGFLDETWLTAFLTTVTPVVVLLIPNKVTPKEVVKAIESDVKVEMAAANALSPAGGSNA